MVRAEQSCLSERLCEAERAWPDIVLTCEVRYRERPFEDYVITDIFACRIRQVSQRRSQCVSRNSGVSSAPAGMAIESDSADIPSGATVGSVLAALHT